MNNKFKINFEVFIQILLLIVGTIAFSYLVGNSFGFVSAQDLSEEELENLRQQFPSRSDEELSEAIALIRQSGGDIDFDSEVDSASDNAQSFSSDFGNSVSTGAGGIWELIMGVVSNFVPGISGISGGDFMQNLLDTTGGPKICPETKNNEICQPMLGKDCDDSCDVECLDGTFEDLPSDSECKLATCYDEDEGTCEPRSTKEKCEDDGGKVLDDQNANSPECAKNCCLAGDQAFFATERQCAKFAETHGLEIGVGVSFNSVESELECLASSSTQKEGACVFSAAGEEKKSCRFTTAENCLADNTGDFYEGTLCSNADLNTNCEKQNSTSCVEGLDGVYWFDSCGNKENIFEGDSNAARERSWNNGLAKKIEDSCSIGTSDEPVRNQKNCGNCNRLRGSICAEEKENQELNDSPDSGFVCIDMGCVDAQGERREHGESWCAYQSQIGLAGPDLGALDILRGIIPSNPITDLIAGDKAVDTPGSLHFRKSCLNGEIEIEPCGNYRNELCEEARTEIAGTDREFSQAACRINRWQECLAYNPSQTEGRIIGMAGEAAGKIIKAKLSATCGLDPDCFVKDVNVDKAFQFSYCAPRYPPGFDLKNNVEAADKICSQASQTCTVIYVKKLSGWECEANCNCEDPTFAKQMNELCTSLGDCGAEVNYVGSQGLGGYAVSEGNNQIKNLLGNLNWIQNFDPAALLDSNYADPIEGEYVHSNSEAIEKVRNSFLSNIFDGISIENLFGGAGGGPKIPENSAVKGGVNIGLVSGGVGAGAVGAAYLFPEISIGVGLIEGTKIPMIYAISNPNPALMGFGGVLAGAAAGLAITSFLIDVLGIGPGLGSAATYTLMGAGAFGGAIIGYNIIAAGELSAGCSAGPIGCIIVAVVIIIILMLKLFGIGDIDEREIKFECKPWTPPLSGECESCGEDKLSDGGDKFPCNKYSCVSLGQNCEFVENSETPDGGLCISVEKTDTSAPKIVSLNEETLTEGFEYRDFSESGFKIRRKRGNDCISQFETINLGFNLDEYGRCAISGERKEKFEEMTQIGGLRANQSFSFNSFDISALGVELSSEDITEVGFYLACEDYLTNSNVNNPYVVNICVDPDDWTPPSIEYQNPGIASFGTESREIIIFVNEPSDVRWSFSDMEFEEMENEFTCDFENKGIRGYACFADIPIDSEREDIFIRAGDHPDSEAENRNTNQESVHIVIERSESVLQIDFIIPNNEIIIGSVPVKTVEVEIKTSGGIDGNAECFLEVDNGLLVLFQNTGGTTHTQQLTTITEGAHAIEARCEDAAGNKAEAEANFEYKVESSTPSVGRVYSQGGSLFVVTNEKAECAYKFNNCGFEVSAGEQMGRTNEGLNHFTSFDKDKTYYVKCKDEFGNEQAGCDIVVSGGMF